MALSDFTLQHPLRVRWSEVDPQSIVFNPNYLMYCDVAVTEYWRAVDAEYPAGFLAHGVDTVVAKATLDFKSAARFDDELLIGVRCARLGRTSLRVLAEITRAGETLVEAEIIYVIVSVGDHTPTPVPEALREGIRGYEQVAPEG